MLNFTVDQKKCVKCKQCVIDCPSSIINMEDEFPTITQDKQKACLNCQHCLAICPTGALSILGIDQGKSIPLKNNLPNYDKVETLVKGRRSIRQYKNENVDTEQINRLLVSALHAPTGVNAMKVHFTIIDDKDIMHKYRNEIYNGIKKAETENKLPEGMEFFSGITKKWYEDDIDIIFRNAPHMIIASAPKSCTTPKVDAVIALSYFDIIASAAGLGTLWCGMAKWSIEDIVPAMRSKLGIPEDHIIGYVMIFGKPSVKYHRTVQKEPANIFRIS